MSKVKKVLTAVAESAAGSVIGGPIGAAAGLLGAGGAGSPRELQRREKAAAADAPAGAEEADLRAVGADANARRARLAGRRGRAGMRVDLGTASRGGSGISVRGR